MINYNFYNSKSDIQSLVHAINLHGEDLIGLELGVYKAESFCTLLHNCPNIKKLYGVDSWEPCVDYLRTPYDASIPVAIIDKKHIEGAKLTAFHNIKFCNCNEKAVIIEKDLNEAIKEIDDSSLDFIFLDAYLDKEGVISQITNWYKKVKPGGLFAGHDWECSVVEEALHHFRKQNNITNSLSFFDNTWIWKK